MQIDSLENNYICRRSLIYFSDKNTFRFAQQYMGQRQLGKAIDILKLIVQAYPDQWYPYSFLADFQLQAKS